MHSLTRIVERKLEVLFPRPEDRLRAAKELQRCSKTTCSPVERLQLAVLKGLKDYDEDISHAVDGALEDPADTVAWAERPNQMKAGMENVKLTPKRVAELESIDWEQYQTWLVEGLK